MDMRLGRFGDRRLEKGGPIFWAGWCLLGGAGRVSTAWVAVDRER
jgi:hypothetical protein